MDKDGINYGAMSKEFLSLHRPYLTWETYCLLVGTPVNPPTMYRMGYFQSYGEIVAVNLAQVGPPPCFLDKCVYETLVNPKADPIYLERKAHHT